MSQGPVNADDMSAPLDQRRVFLRRWRWPLLIAGPVLIVLIVALLAFQGGRRQSTDDAYVQVTKTPVAPAVDGRIVEVYVKENEPVKKGQRLFKLDPVDFQAAVDAAAARLADAQLQVRSQTANYNQQGANLGLAREAVAYAGSNLARTRRMVAAGVASRADLDQATHAATEARAQVAVAEQQAAQALANLGGSTQGALSNHPSVLKARADLEQARIALARTVVTAPTDGVVAGVRKNPPGAYLKASQTSFWLLSGVPWVEANFKEDQLSRMKNGQPVKVRVDAYKHEALAAHVTDIAPATGAIFSVMPAQNASGNWVKVVQRLPVRIDFDQPPPDMAARAGLSATVTVDVSAPGKTTTLR